MSLVLILHIHKDYFHGHNRHTSSGLLAILVGVAFIGLGGVNLAFLMVSPKLNSTFLVLPNPTPYSDLELLSL
jgi:hypothetical protein